MVIICDDIKIALEHTPPEILNKKSFLERIISRIESRILNTPEYTETDLEIKINMEDFTMVVELSNQSTGFLFGLSEDSELGKFLIYKYKTLGGDKEKVTQRSEQISDLSTDSANSVSDKIYYIINGIIARILQKGGEVTENTLDEKISLMEDFMMKIAADIEDIPQDQLYEGLPLQAVILAEALHIRGYKTEFRSIIDSLGIKYSRKIAHDIAESLTPQDLDTVRLILDDYTRTFKEYTSKMVEWSIANKGFK